MKFFFFLSTNWISSNRLIYKAKQTDEQQIKSIKYNNTQMQITNFSIKNFLNWEKKCHLGRPFKASTKSIKNSW